MTTTSLPVLMAAIKPFLLHWVEQDTSTIRPKVDAFGLLLDASINWETENFTISLFGKNLTDETYLMSFLDVGGNNVATSATDTTPVYAPGSLVFGTPNRPRYFGAEMQIKF